MSAFFVGVLLVSAKVFGYYPWWVVRSLREIAFCLLRVPFFFFFFLYRPQVDPIFFSPFLIFAYRMTRGHIEVLISQAGRRRGTPGETPT